MLPEVSPKLLPKSEDLRLQHLLAWQVELAKATEDGLLYVQGTTSSLDPTATMENEFNVARSGA